nr:hypothetical protein [Acidimicrobiales bacterium]
IRPDRVTDTAIGSVLTGTIDQPEAHDLWFFEGRAGQRLSIGPPDCDDAGIPVELLAPDGGLLIVATGCTIEDVELPEDGTYELTVNPNDDRPGTYRLPLRGV